MENEFNNLEKVYLTDIADIYVNDDTTKIWPAGCSVIRLGCSNDEVEFHSEDGTIRQRTAVLYPRNGMNPMYLYLTLSSYYPDYYRRVHVGLNFSIHDLKKMELAIHRDKKTQSNVSKAIGAIVIAEEREKKALEKALQFKEFLLDKMFI